MSLVVLYFLPGSQMETLLRFVRFLWVEPCQVAWLNQFDHISTNNGNKLNNVTFLFTQQKQN